MNGQLPFQNLIDVIAAGRGEQVAELLKLDCPAHQQSIAQLRTKKGALAGDRLGLIQKRIAAQTGVQHWSTVLEFHARCLHSVYQNDYVDAFDQLHTYIPKINDIYRAEDPGAWMVPVVIQAAENLRLLAYKADDQLLSQQKQQCKMEEAGSTLQKVYASAAGGRANGVKKQAMLALTNTMFKLYFKLNTLRNCKPLLRGLFMSSNPDFEEYPKAHRVTHKFYTGRLHIFEGKLPDAEKDLEYAFTHCHSKQRHNKRLILYFLVSVRLLAGVLPAESLLREYNLQHFIPIVQAMKCGSPLLLAKALKKYQHELIRQGVYLVLIRLKPIVLRRLFKSCWIIHKQESDKPNVFPLSELRKAVAWQEMDMDDDALECAVANLIHKKLVKGYISHKQQCVVLSKIDPFPPLLALENITN